MGASNKKTKEIINKYLINTILIIIALVEAYPIFLIVINSFKNTKQFISNPLGIPTTISFDNMLNAMGRMNYFNALKNNMIILALSLTTIVFLASLAAFPIAKRPSKAKNIIYSYFLSGMVLPSFTALVPIILLMRNLKLINTYPSAVIVYTAGAMPFAIMLYTAFFKSIPRELEDAALIDGANMFQAYLKIYMPLLKSATVTIVVLQSVGIWNDFLMPYLLFTKDKMRTLIPALYNFYSNQLGQGVHWELIFPAMLVTILPLVITFLIANKSFINGMIEGSVKG